MNLAGFIVLAVISILLGKLFFSADQPSVQQASKPSVRNLIWQLALVVSASLSISSFVSDEVVEGRVVWLMVSCSVLAFALICLFRTLLNVQNNRGAT